MGKTANPLRCGPVSASRLAPYEPRISANFEIPQHIGKLVAAWDRAQCVPADQAGHMRDDDYVVGLTYRGHCRAYPLWITDYYHIINDRIAGDPILFSTCERCQSGSAFLSTIGEQRAAFSAMGMYNASLTMVNRKREKGQIHSLWLHYEGVAIDGPEAGQFLEQIPTFHMTWRQWADLHPDTDVMLAPDDPHHRDARHGHGREEIFSRPGMDPPLAKTITGRFDEQYPENELVLGVNIDAGIRAYPLLEIKREGGVLNDQLGDVPIVILSGPLPEQVTMSAFARALDDRVLTFEHGGQAFQDRETGSEWNIEGLAVSGPLRGKQLLPVRWQIVRWHAWVYPHPGTELFVSSKPRPRYPDFPAYDAMETFREPLESLAERGEMLTFSHVIWELGLPHEATAGLCVNLGRDRLNLYAFESSHAAADYVALQGAWFCWPFDAKLARKRSLRFGSHVIESDPVEQYAEPTQTVHFPDNQTPWAAFVQESVSDKTDKAEASVQGPFTAMIEHLKQSRYDVVECAFLPHSQLRVGTVSAISATINADRFAVYRCADDQAAQSVAEEVGHAVVAGCWVFRSIPVLMYEEPHYEMGQLPDEEINWSGLLDDQKFQEALEAFLDG